MYRMEVGQTQHKILYELGVYSMATTGELRAIIEALELVDIGDAASYLGEEATVGEASQISAHIAQVYGSDAQHSVMCDCTACIQQA